jgi:hydroxypyruvate reductase 1
MASQSQWKIFNPSGSPKIIVTRDLPGSGWHEILSAAGYRTEVWIERESLPRKQLVERMGTGCRAVIGQLTEKWDRELFRILHDAGGEAYCNLAVGFDNIDLNAATENMIAVGNTPGVLTEATAELAVALTVACSRRIVESDTFMRTGKFTGWLPDLFLGKRLWKSTLGVIGTGRIGSAYAKMMVRAFQMDLIYLSNRRNEALEAEITAFNDALLRSGSESVRIIFTESLEYLLRNSDVVSLHVPLTQETRGLITGEHLRMMKSDAALVNTSRGAVLIEADLADHCMKNQEFMAGLDVFENEPDINEVLKTLPNVTMAPHIGSATKWTRENMSRLAAFNIKGVIEGYPVWDKGSIDPFLTHEPPKAIPSILNMSVLSGNKT